MRPRVTSATRPAQPLTVREVRSRAFERERRRLDQRERPFERLVVVVLEHSLAPRDRRERPPPFGALRRDPETRERSASVLPVSAMQVRLDEVGQERNRARLDVRTRNPDPLRRNELIDRVFVTAEPEREQAERTARVELVTDQSSAGRRKR